MANTELEPLQFMCPRCSSHSVADYYGPCEVCRNDLRAKYVGEATEMKVVAYEPKMNVTPNAVALKE